MGQKRVYEIRYPLWMAPYQNTSMSSAMWVFKSPYFPLHFFTKYVEDVKIHIVIRQDHSTKSPNNDLVTFALLYLEYVKYLLIKVCDVVISTVFLIFNCNFLYKLFTTYIVSEPLLVQEKSHY